MQIQPILKAINFKNNTDYQKTMIKREKLWQQTQALDDIGTLCLLGGLLLSPDINIVVSKNKTPKIKYYDRILFGIGAIAVFAAMIRRNILANKIKD